MFMWKYFFLYVFIGFLNGFTNPFEVRATRSIDKLFPIVSILAIVLIIWDFSTFGASWGFLSIGEFFIGYFVGKTVARKVL